MLIGVGGSGKQSLTKMAVSLFKVSCYIPGNMSRIILCIEKKVDFMKKKGE